MGLDTETGVVFCRRKGRTIRHLVKHQGIAMDFHYLDTETGNEFDVRDLPAEYLADDRCGVMTGDREAHKRAIGRAVANDHDFRNEPFKGNRPKGASRLGM